MPTAKLLILILLLFYYRWKYQGWGFPRPFIDMNPTYIHKNMVHTHHFILLSATTLCKMTVYDLQLLHVRYRIEIKKKEMNYCLRTRYQ